MKDFRFNYIITIHNKQDLIEQVMLGVISAWREGSFIYPVLDGCTDDTEKIINRIAKSYPEVPIVKIFAPDVHEIKSINIALRQISQNQRGCNFILQDDVVLQEPDLEAKVLAIYETFGYNQIGCLAFRHGVNVFLNEKRKILEERDLIESVYGVGMCSRPLLPGQIIERMVGVRSPECISCATVAKVGLMDEALAPYTYDNHDISLRCLEAGLHNYVFGLKFKSDIEWGGTRVNPHPGYSSVLERNKSYLYKKHKSFLSQYKLTSEFYRLKNAKSFGVRNITQDFFEQFFSLGVYRKRRLRLVGKKIYFISKYVKEPIKKILIKLRLY